MQPKLIIHGGLSSAAGFRRNKDKEREALAVVANNAFAYLATRSAVETAAFAVSLLEDNPLFNAGTGSKLQSDGIIRMTASIMDGAKERFAGVINIREVKNPVQIAAKLLSYDDRVLASEEALTFARSHGFPAYNPETPRCREAFEARLRGKTGTVGCVVLDSDGRLAAATSTGGKGYEIPGRVSDSSTVAGNYANPHAAVSCTGTGEDIVNMALAARVVTRVSDGMNLQEAADRSIMEMRAHKGDAGFIALDKHGHMLQAATDPYLSYAMHDGTCTVF